MKKLTALITGATGPLGQEITRALAQAGYRVLINYRRDRRTAKKLARETNGKIFRADVTKIGDVKKLFKLVESVDVLINGVGNFIYKPLDKTSAKELTKIIESNLLSAWYCAQAALPGMRRRKFGRIINFGSAGCDKLTARPLTTPYYIAKTGLLMLTRSLANEEKTSGITINMIAPGVLPHGVRPTGAPVVSYREITRAILATLKKKGLTGAYCEVSRGWRPE